MRNFPINKLHTSYIRIYIPNNLLDVIHSTLDKVGICNKVTTKGHYTYNSLQDGQ